MLPYTRASNTFVIIGFPCQYARVECWFRCIPPPPPHPPPLLAVLPPVLVPRNPEVIAAGARYEPIPSYLDTQRSIYSPDNECPSLHFDTPGTHVARGNMPCAHICVWPLLEALLWKMHFNSNCCSLETPPPAYSEAGSPTPSDPSSVSSVMDGEYLMPGIGVWCVCACACLCAFVCMVCCDVCNVRVCSLWVCMVQCVPLCTVLCCQTLPMWCTRFVVVQTLWEHRGDVWRTACVNLSA